MTRPEPWIHLPDTGDYRIDVRPRLLTPDLPPDRGDAERGGGVDGTVNVLTLIDRLLAFGTVRP